MALVAGPLRKEFFFRLPIGNAEKVNTGLAQLTVKHMQICQIWTISPKIDEILKKGIYKFE